MRLQNLTERERIIYRIGQADALRTHWLVIAEQRQQENVDGADTALGIAGEYEETLEKHFRELAEIEDEESRRPCHGG